MQINSIGQQPNFGYGSVSAYKVRAVDPQKLHDVAVYTNFVGDLSNYKAVLNKLPRFYSRPQGSDTLFLMPKDGFYGDIIRIDCKEGEGQAMREKLAKGIHDAADKTRYEVAQ